MKHQFIIIDSKEIPETTTYKLKDNHELIIVDDEIIVNNELFLNGFKTFKVSFKNPSEGLDYWGNTIIPTQSLDDFMRNIKKVERKTEKGSIQRELDNLISLCYKAKKENKYIVHFGI